MKRILALVLSLVMALSLCAPAWGVAEVTVSDGTVTSDYTNLASAIASVDAGGTVKVLSDITLANSIIEVSSNVTIEAADPANPVTITATVEDAFKVVAGGKLTLGEGLIINGPNTILFVNGGSAVIDGAELNLTSDRHNSGVYVYNGSIEFKDGAINGNSLTLCVDAGSSAIVSGGSITSANESALAAMGGSNVTISGSAVLTSKKAAAYATGDATITVDGGTLTSTNSAALIAAKFTESTGGTVIMNNGTVQGVLAHEHADAAATITGGTVTGNVAAKDGATLSITGGTFDVAPNAEYIKVGYEFKDGQVSEIVPEPVYYTLTVKHVDEDGTAVADEVTDSVEAKTTYSTTAKVIDGYEAGVLKEGSDAASGTMDSDKTVIYVYAKEPVSDNPTPDDPSTGTDVPATGTDVPDDPTPEEPTPEEPTPDEPTPDEPTPEEPTPEEPADEPESVTVPSNEAADLVKKPNTKIDFKNGYSQSDLDNADDEDISTKFVITVDSSATVPSDVENKLKNADEVICLDIDLHLYIDGKHAGDITELHRPVEIRIPVSLFDFDSVAKGHTRHYYVVRLHDGEVEVLKAKLVGDELVIRSDRFSPYYVAYEDVKASPSFGWGTTTTTNPDVNSPKTFDAGIALYVGMSVAAAVGTVVVSKKRKD